MIPTDNAAINRARLLEMVKANPAPYDRDGLFDWDLLRHDIHVLVYHNDEISRYLPWAPWLASGAPGASPEGGTET